jgi:hypothetical protein
LASDRLTLARAPASRRRLTACQARRLPLLTVDANEARRLREDDPAVQAGLYEIEVFTWMVPSGALQFGPASSPLDGAG